MAWGLRTTFCIVFLLTVGAQTASAQNVTGGIEEIKELACREWTLDYMSTDGKQFPIAGFMSITISLRPDFTFHILAVVGETKEEKGNWKYDEQKKHIALITSTNPMLITNLTESGIVVMEDPTATGRRETPPNSELHFIPKK